MMSGETRGQNISGDSQRSWCAVMWVFFFRLYISKTLKQVPFQGDFLDPSINQINSVVQCFVISWFYSELAHVMYQVNVDCGPPVSLRCPAEGCANRTRVAIK